jgi:hypothetical protein
MTPQEWSQEKFARDYKRTLAIQTELQQQQQQQQGDSVRQQLGNSAKAGVPLTPQQQQALAAAAAQRRTMGAQMNQQMAGVNQNRQNVPGQQQQATASNTGTVPSMSPAQQMQAIQNLQRAGQLNLQRQQQIQQMGQLPSQTANLVAAHLSPSGGMQNAHQQQLLAAAIQRSNYANNNGFAGMNGLSTSPTSAANSINSHLVLMIQQLQAQHPGLSFDQARQVATERLRVRMSRDAQAIASGNAMGLTQQQLAAAGHMNLNGQATQQQMLAALAHAQQQQQVQNGTLGPMASAPQGLAAVMAQQGQSPTNPISSPNPGLVANSPTQMYRGVPAAVAAANRLGSGSPGLVPARPDSRGSIHVGTPGGLGAGMVRSASNMSGVSNGGAGSPVIGAGGFVGVAR